MAGNSNNSKEVANAGCAAGLFGCLFMFASWAGLALFIIVIAWIIANWIV